MTKTQKKSFVSYRGQLLDLAKLYGVVEIKSYARSHKRLTTSQLELILIKNNIKLPVNRSSVRIIEQQEIREKSITNIYLSIFFILFVASMIVTRPYIKNIVEEVRFTSKAAQYTDIQVNKLKKIEKDGKKKEALLENKKKEALLENKIDERSRNAISLNAETTLNLFEDLEYDLKSVRNGQKVKPIYLTKLPKDLRTLGDTKKKRELFIKIVLPLILSENSKITEDRKKLFKILGKNFNTVGERVWLKRRFKEYKIDDRDLSKLKIRMDIIPVSIALAQEKV